MIILPCGSTFGGFRNSRSVQIRAIRGRSSGRNAWLWHPNFQLLTSARLLLPPRLRSLRYLACRCSLPLSQPPALARLDDVAGALGRTAAAGIRGPVPKTETVVEGDLLALGDVTRRDDPDTPAPYLRAAVRGAGMIDEPAHVAAMPRVEVVTLVEPERHGADVPPPPHLLEPLRLPPGALGLRDPLAPVLDDHIPGRDRHPRIDAVSMDARAVASDHPRRWEERIGACRSCAQVEGESEAPDARATARQVSIRFRPRMAWEVGRDRRARRRAVFSPQRARRQRRTQRVKTTNPHLWTLMADIGERQVMRTLEVGRDRRMRRRAGDSPQSTRKAPRSELIRLCALCGETSGQD